MNNRDKLKRLTALSLIGVMSVTNPKLVNAKHEIYQNEVTYSFVPTVTLTQNANIRVGASTNSSIITVLPVGTSLFLKAEYPEWYEVELNGYTCYVSKTCAIISTQSQVNNNSVKYSTTNDYANLYSDASYNNYIGVIPPNVSVETYLEDGDFIFIKYNNQVGFIEKNRVNGYHNGYYHNGNYYNNHDHCHQRPSKHHRYRDYSKDKKYYVYEESYFDATYDIDYSVPPKKPEESNVYPPLHRDDNSNSVDDNYYKSLKR